jgi:hypothetical protein
MLMFRHLILLLAPVFAIAASNVAEAGHHRCHTCCAAAAPCDSCCSSPCAAAKTAYQEVEKTVMVPTIVTEMRKIAVTKFRDEQRTRDITVLKNVPEVKTREISKTTMIPEVRTRKIDYTECKAVTTQKQVNYTVKVPQTLTKTIRWMVKQPIRTEREETYTVNVPTFEQRTGTRQVCKFVPVTKTKTITEDQGHWETQVVPQTLTADKSSDGDSQPAPCCGDKAPAEQTACTALKRVWVPNMVTRDLEITCQEKTFEDQQYTYNVTVYKPETRTRKVFDLDFVLEERTRDVQVTKCLPETRTKTVNIVRYINEPKTREEQYTVMIPQVKTATQEYTVIKQVPETRTQSYTVKVPYTEQQEVPTKVCRLVAKTIKVRVAVPCAEAAPAAPAAPCCN